MESSRTLLLKPSVRGQLPALGVLVGFLVFEVFIAVRGLLEPWLAIACPAVFVVVLAIGTVSLMRSRGKPWQLRCGPDGVEARGFDLVPWSALAQVRVSRLRPRWLYFAVPGRHRVVAFVPRPGVSVPAVAVFDPLSRRGASSRWGARWQRKWYGSTFVVFTHTVDATSEEIAEAVRQLTDVPVVADRVRLRRRGAGLR
ncbi:hypothetical protein ACFVYA_29495 [Amycolatopsis sp. NPDC058278]|uniref:hypothetical protein n=1 Tax=Amycolatopsis sp. NPDC058278 TaxID=3346417 RepID=UPI0036D7DFCC